MRLAKLLMDAGLDFASANRIASNLDVRRIFQDRRPSDELVLTWHPFQEFMVFDKEDLVHLKDRLENLQQRHAVNTIIHLAPIWAGVYSQMRALEVTASADVATVRNASPDSAVAVVANCSTQFLSKEDA